MKTKLLLVAIVFCFSCTYAPKDKIRQRDPLPSWNEGATKTSIINFVHEISNSENKHFVPVADRVAVFDNDGTLWSEQPFYFQLFFAIDRVKELALQHPEWKNEQPFKAIIENDFGELKKIGVSELLQIVMATHAGKTTEEFEDLVKDWLSTAKHPRFKRPFTDLVYQPMLELIQFLQANSFKVFIVSAGGVDFMRPWVEEIYNIPRDQVVGSSIKTAFEFENGHPVIKKLAEVDFIDDKEGKPIAINQRIGRKPVFSCGNSDGDLAMMQWTASGSGKRFMLYLHHTDSIREWAYDRDSAVGRLAIGLDAAESEGWTIADMEKDWKIVYPFDLNAR